jgi:hypothetical protein
MYTAGAKFSFRDVVLVADRIDSTNFEGPAHARRDLEMTDEKTLRSLQSAIASLGLKVWHYDSPEMLARHADLHAEDIVLAIYGGGRHCDGPDKRTPASFAGNRWIFRPASSRGS